MDAFAWVLVGFFAGIVFTLLVCFPATDADDL